MYNRTEILERNKEYIIEQYKNPDITQTQIALNVGVNPSTLNRYAKSLGLTKTVKTKMTSEHRKWLKTHHHLTYAQMSSHTGCCAEVIRTTLKDMGIERNNPYRPFKLDMTDEEFLKDLDDPKLCAPDIVRKYQEKYGIGESRIHQLRKQRGVKLQINTISRESFPELRVRVLLDSLGVSYIREKRFGKYSVDFYLGYKVSLEVHGDYWHSKPSRIESDKRKRKYLESLGHTVLVVWEKDIPDARKYLIGMLEELGFPVQRCTEK